MPEQFGHDERRSASQPPSMTTYRCIDDHEKTFYLIPSMYKSTSKATFLPIFVAFDALRFLGNY